MQEFVFYSEKPLELPLNESILCSQEGSTDESHFIVSNDKAFNAQIIAPEINFYLNNTNDPVAKQIKNVEKLYEVNAIRFDLAQDIVYSQEVTNQVLLVGSDENKLDFLMACENKEFDLFHVDASIVRSITGHIGNLSVIVDDEGEDVELNVSQIVWFNAQPIAFEQSGAFDPETSSIEEVVNTLRENISSYEYRKFTTYDSNICQYHERREEICGKCADVCPTVAIVKEDSEKHLHFSQIDCHGCGGCVSVCPSGAIDYAPTSRESIFEMSRFYQGHIPLIIPQKNMNIENLELSLKEDVLPLTIDGEKFLHEASLLTLAQESGSQVIFYSDFISKGTRDSISILNQVYQAKFGLDAVIIAMNEEQLKAALESVQFIENSRYSYNQTTERKREIFAIRLSHLVGQEDLGVVTTGEHVHYGHVKVNQDNCTLCLSCVGSCNVNALTAHTDDNTLRVNPSLCTSCGYCEVSCPEQDCLTIERDVIKLSPAWFKDEILAQDELFACVECGKEFATKKSIEKIATIMSPIFAADPIKERTLYCCEDCKPKIMMHAYMADRSNYNNPTVKA